MPNKSTAAKRNESPGADGALKAAPRPVPVQNTPA